MQEPFCQTAPGPVLAEATLAETDVRALIRLMGEVPGIATHMKEADIGSFVIVMQPIDERRITEQSSPEGRASLYCLSAQSLPWCGPLIR